MTNVYSDPNIEAFRELVTLLFQECGWTDDIDTAFDAIYDIDELVEQRVAVRLQAFTKLLDELQAVKARTDLLNGVSIGLNMACVGIRRILDGEQS